MPKTPYLILLSYQSLEIGFIQWQASVELAFEIAAVPVTFEVLSLLN